MTALCPCRRPLPRPSITLRLTDPKAYAEQKAAAAAGRCVVCYTVDLYIKAVRK